MSGTLSIVLESGLALRAYVQLRDSFLNVPITFVLTENSEPGLYEVQLSGLTTDEYYYASFVDAGTREVVGYTNIFLWDGANAIDQVVGGSGGLTPSQATELTNINTRTARVDALIEDSSGDQFTPKALSQAPSGGGGGDATAANQTAIIDAIAATQGAGFDTATDSLESLRDRGDDFWTTATGFAVAGDAMNLVTDAVDADALAPDAIAEINATVDVALTDYGANTVAPDNAGIAAIPTNPLLVTDSRMDNLDAAISTRSTFDHTTDPVVASNMRGTDGANTVAPDNAGIAANASAIVNIPTNPLLTNDTRLNNLDAPVSGANTQTPLDSTQAQAAAAAALTAYGPPTRAEATADKNEVISALPTPSDATLANQQAILNAATAFADGRGVADYANATYTVYNADGTVRTVFDLYQEDGTSPATSAQNAVERRPQ